MGLTMQSQSFLRNFLVFGTFFLGATTMFSTTETEPTLEQPEKPGQTEEPSKPTLSPIDLINSWPNLARQTKVGTYEALKAARLVTPAVDEDGNEIFYTVKNSRYVSAPDALGFTKQDIEDAGTVYQRLKGGLTDTEDMMHLVIQIVSSYEKDVVETRRDFNNLTDVINEVIVQQRNLESLIAACGALVIDSTENESLNDETTYNKLMEKANEILIDIQKGKDTVTNPYFPPAYSKEAIDNPDLYTCHNEYCPNSGIPNPVIPEYDPDDDVRPDPDEGDTLEPDPDDPENP